MPAKADEPDLAELLKAARETFDGVTAQVRDVFEEWSEEAQYRLDKEFGKQLSKHPELYAELKRGYRQFRKGLDKFAKDLGL